MVLELLIIVIELILFMTSIICAVILFLLCCVSFIFVEIGENFGCCKNIQCRGLGKEL